MPPSPERTMYKALVEQQKCRMDLLYFKQKRTAANAEIRRLNKRLLELNATVSKLACGGSDATRRAPTP